MKKLIIAGLAIAGISTFSYAASYGEDCKGASRFISNLDLDDARAYEVEQILSNFKQVKELAKSGQHAHIPVFIEEQQAYLAAVLTEDELQQFKENVGEWVADKDLSKYKMFSGMQKPR